eukprot:CAMPEP_0206616938 /NCGR_PEP_ID=MMETSP0325_2-20121206/59296_1 /ASSEMBLY_ACC=CAM_ASM_000347 /TAXON_ID=2866 /ORGANISM="Crypthecodinium cohnii, Strain Seligo" /LENGTH=659 /DNA_ID=CAMNT_0054138743 /DNA_START=121 /DNA_END=2099 /DNA_ORIENTATION=-
MPPSESDRDGLVHRRGRKREPAQDTDKDDEVKEGGEFSSYSGVFLLGIMCSMYMWPASIPMPETVSSAAASLYANTSNEYLADFMDRVMDGTAKMRELWDEQATSFKGRLQDASFRIQDVFRSVKVPGIDTFRSSGAEEDRVGVRMNRQGVTVRHPVVMIPGIITTGLEVWDGEDCIRTWFRQRIWGSTSMMRQLFTDPECWARHLALNATTGLDPLQRPHYNRSIRVRPAQGFESADFFVAGYWVWGLLIEALADIGYDYNTMYMASYDWRLAYADLEKRDRYFTRLRNQIETLVSLTGEKAVIVTHSMGGNVWHYFMQWVTYRVHRNWVHDYISAEVDISAPMLGLPKAYYSLLMGDNRDFAAMGRGFSDIVTHIFGPMSRRTLWRTCSSLAMIMPVGGDGIWNGNLTGRPLVQLDGRNLSAAEAMDLLASEENMPEELKRISPWLLDGIRRTRPAEVRRGASVPEPPEHVWANMLASPLPFAPEMRKYAFYGVGVPTDVTAVVGDTGDDVNSVRYTVIRHATDHMGYHLGNGDYAVPLRSLGLMCKKGWQDPQRNPARTPCIVREYMDNPKSAATVADDMAALQAAKAAGASPGQMLTMMLSGGHNRGGQPSGDHVDILGNKEMLADLLTVVSGGEVEERILSDLEDIATKWGDPR